MDKSRVALARCEDYGEARVYAAAKEAIGLLGGMARFVQPSEKILMKPNVLIGSSPEKYVTTHPAVLKAVARLLQEAGAEVSYGDSPAFGGCEFNMKRAGLKQAGDELGLTVADFDKGREVSHKTALLNKRFTIANGVLDADGLISLPKLKTHGITRLTGAVKNQFGCVPGFLKGQFHTRIADPYDFATMLVDLNTLIRPRLYVMDGIVAMEGNGPRNGKSREMNVLLVSTDPIALDATASRMIGLNPEFVPTSAPGELSGLGTYHSENIEIVGDPFESFVVHDFDVTRQPPMKATAGFIRTLLRDTIVSRPVIDLARCTSCGTCIKMCPVGPSAIDWMQHEAGKAPGHNYRHCIRCYCCQELCPEGAITIHNPMVAQIDLPKLMDLAQHRIKSCFYTGSTP